MQQRRKLIFDYGIAFLASAGTAGICYPISSAIGYQTVGLIFLIVVAGLSLFLGRSALIFAAILNFAVWNFLFITPLYTFRVHNLHDLIALFANLVVAIVGSTLINRIRKSQLSLRKSQERLRILYGFLESLNNAVSIKDVVKRAQELLKNHFEAELVIYLKEKESDQLSAIPFGNKAMHDYQSFPRAINIYQGNLPPVTKESDTGPNHVTFYLLEEPRKRIGVIGISMPGTIRSDEEKHMMLHSFIDQIASALDREISIDQAKEKEFFTESEKLFGTVLSSVSHELKTPIAIISAAVSNLRDTHTSANPDNREQIIRELESTSVRLNHLVENILDMSRIESGMLRLNLQYCDVSDLIGSVVNLLKSESQDRHIRVHIGEDFPLIQSDITLLTQALINVLRNAIMYSPGGSEIHIAGNLLESGKIEINIVDEGPGVPASSLVHLCDKFYRVPGTKPGGTGLGLTITRAIIEAHGGSLFIRNEPAGGLRVSFVLLQHPEDQHAKKPL